MGDEERRDVLQMIKKGRRLMVLYQVCGSGGFVIVREVYLQDAINNP